MLIIKLAKTLTINFNSNDNSKNNNNRNDTNTRNKNIDTKDNIWWNFRTFKIMVEFDRL